MTKKLSTLLALLAALTLLAAACGGGDTASEGEDTGSASGTEETTEETTDEPTEEDTAAAEGEAVSAGIAYQGPLTGDNAALGVNMVRGVELALEDCRDQYSVDLTLTELDSQGSPDQAPALAQQAAADDSIVAVIGPAFSGETAASGPIYEQAGLPFVSPSATNPDLSENGWTYFFRTVATDATQGPVAAKFISENLSASNVAVIDDASEYGKGLADIVEEELEAAGATVVLREGIEAGGTDFSTVVGQVVQSGADAIFYGGYFSDAGLLRKQLVENGGQDITFVSDDGAFDQGFIDIAGDSAAEGSYVTFPGADPLSVDEEFLNRYSEMHGGDAAPGAFTIEAYQNTMLVCQAIAEVGADRDAVRDFIADFDGEIFGKQISFSETGDIAAQTFFIYEAQDGQFTQQEEVSVSAEGGDSGGEATTEATETES